MQEVSEVKIRLPRYRTIKECFLAIKLLDDGTAITEWKIRSMCKHGEVNYIASGNKSLVNLDDLLSRLGIIYA
jgi:hypothetical protein